MAGTYVIIQARMTSSRLPKKTLLPLAGKSMLHHVIDRCKRIEGIDGICVASPVGEEHMPIADAVKDLDNVAFFQGDEHNVLERTLGAAKHVNADTILRVTSDCPFIDPDVSSALLKAYRTAKVKYARLTIKTGYPLGFDTEVLPVELLETAVSEDPDQYEKEHATPFIWRRPERFPAIWMDHQPNRRHWRLVVDEENDYEMACAAYEELMKVNPEFTYQDLIDLFERRPDILEMNQTVQQTPYIHKAK